VEEGGEKGKETNPPHDGKERGTLGTSTFQRNGEKEVQVTERKGKG